MSDEYFRAAVAALPTGTDTPPALDLDRLFGWQATSRALDLTARRLGKQGLGYYSIGSAGHESNALVAAALRPSDPALLHYRSGGFYLARAAQVPGSDPVRDVLRGIVASAREPISGGRHKVFGNAALSIIPQTSTIASHLPRAVGLAFATARTGGSEIVVCSFGDASANHSTAQGALNASAHTAYSGLRLPLLFVCEDNGIGISVRTPRGWIEHSLANRLPYFAADGTDPEGLAEVATEAAEFVRSQGKPALLHLSTVRLFGHAGSDVEAGYRSGSDIRADLERDPLLATARLLAGTGTKPAELLERYDRITAEVDAVAEEVAAEPKLTDRAAITAPLATAVPPMPERPGAEPATLAQGINSALAELLADPKTLVFGEDVARKGGVYGVTKGLRKRFGERVFDTLLDEQSILGVALGAGLAGFLPVPEIQYLAYLHNAIDQLRGEAATLPFFSAGQYGNPMVVRIAGYAYQKGFGGHFHNDNSIAALRDIPGIFVATPATATDARELLPACAHAAREHGTASVFLEPIALYHTRDLHESGDEGWLRPLEPAAPHCGRVYGSGTELTIITSGNGVLMSLRVAKKLAARGIRARVLDLRWLAPLPVSDILEQARASGAVLLADETRHSGGISESVLAALVDNGFRGPIKRVTSADSFIPLGAAAGEVLLSEAEIEAGALAVLGR
ncbi:thiamine pyrophosphate-dependent enzyme [Sciscionella sediminilitoris]|uniref:thiamine pyrophosphate-dependent enzyme n=1 Tax=Sciscionella sediminilitoris TaxID=1445613 RepID=UPI001E34FC66|nr:thiamine pyrophosphate-dependent enzyme [Sciscionella sp. SE31]